MLCKADTNVSDSMMLCNCGIEPPPLKAGFSVSKVSCCAAWLGRRYFSDVQYRQLKQQQ